MYEKREANNADPECYGTPTSLSYMDNYASTGVDVNWRLRIDVDADFIDEFNEAILSMAEQDTLEVYETPDLIERIADELDDIYDTVLAGENPFQQPIHVPGAPAATG
jgi:hypothetical protein